jgi:hypothetical protein
MLWVKDRSSESVKEVERATMEVKLETSNSQVSATQSHVTMMVFLILKLIQMSSLKNNPMH